MVGERLLAPMVVLMLAGCGGRTGLEHADLDAASTDAGIDACVEGSLGSPAIVAGEDFGAPSCNGIARRGFIVSSFGCPIVEITPAFADGSDGSDGQPVAFSISNETGCFAMTWDDCPSECDCDLDVAHEVCVLATRSCSTLTVSVTNTVEDHEAANSVEAGFAIGDGTRTLRSSGSETRTFAFPCAR